MAGLRFPKRCLRVTVSAIDRLEVTMHAAFSKSGALRKAPDALLSILPNRVTNENTFSPQSPSVGPCSAGWLKSWQKSALQSTRSTTDCPALGGYPIPATQSIGRWFMAAFGDLGWEPPGYRLFDAGTNAATGAGLVSPVVPQHQDTGVMLHHAARPWGYGTTVA